MRRKMLVLGLAVTVAVAVWTVAGRAADKNRDWPAYSGDKASTKYSSLDQINKDTIKNLHIAWRQSGVPAELKRPFRTRRDRPTGRTRRSWSAACST